MIDHKMSLNIHTSIHTDIFGHDGTQTLVTARIFVRNNRYWIYFWSSLTLNDFQKEFQPIYAYISLHEARCNISCFPIKHNRKDPRVSTQSGLVYLKQCAGVYYNHYTMLAMSGLALVQWLQNFTAFLWCSVGSLWPN